MDRATHGEMGRETIRETSGAMGGEREGMRGRRLWASFTAVCVMIVLGVLADRAGADSLSEDPVSSGTQRTRLQPSPYFFPDGYDSVAMRDGDFLTIPTHEGMITIQSNRTLGVFLPPDEGRCCGSMYPAISNRSAVLTIVPKEDEIHVGDIIAFRCTDEIYLMHRVIAITTNEEGTFYLTKGDNNRVDDHEGFGCLPTYANVSHKIVGVLY